MESWSPVTVTGDEPGRRRYSSGPHTLLEVLTASTGWPDLDYLVEGGNRVTFGDNLAWSARWAAILADRYGVTLGDRVAVAMRNHTELVTLFWASQRLGAVFVPLNAWWSAGELRAVLTELDPRVMVVDEERLDRLEGTGHGVPAVVVRASGPHPGVADFDALDSTSPDPGRTWQDAPVTPDTLSTILYTSGTTGAARGAMITHGNHCTRVRNSFVVAGGPADVAGRNLPQPGVLMPLPLFHVTGLGAIYTSVATGSKVALLRKWDAATAVDLIAAEGLTSFTGVVAIADAFLDECARRPDDVRTLRSVAFGAGVVRPDLVDRVRSDFGGLVSVSTGYGMTESTSIVTSIAGQEYWEHPTSVGRPGPVNDLRVVDEDGEDVAPGGAGEILVGGPNVVTGYWRASQATETAFRDGWHVSGDVGRLDEDGRLHLLDRKKDVIIRGGENVFAAEVESVLGAHPAVDEVAVVGLAHRQFGEEVCAVVRPVAGAELTVDELVEHARSRLAHYKVPTTVHLVTEPLPRTATGKVLKQEVVSGLASERVSTS